MQNPILPNTNNQKKVMKIIIFIVAILVIMFFVIRKDNEENVNTDDNKTINKTIVIETINNEKPVGFPDNLPLNGEMKIIKSYNVETPNPETKQASIVFDSSKTAQENYDFYLKWGEENEWEITNTNNQENIKSIYLEKGKEDINIVITNNKEGQSQISISWAII